jgi:hypothetical protein
MLIRCKYKTGYWEYNRIWNKAYAGKFKFNINYFGHASFISPRGNLIRMCGLGSSGTVRFWNEKTKKFRDLDYGTILRALMLGWQWKNDKNNS